VIEKRTNITLPITIEVKVGSYYRVTIPKYLNFIEENDIISGTIKISGMDSLFPFEKKVSSNRTITVGFIKSSIIDEKIPERIILTINSVKHQDKPKSSFASLSFLQEGNNLLTIHSAGAVNNETILYLKEKSLRYIEEQYKPQEFENKFLFLAVEYLKKEKTWAVPIAYKLQGDFSENILGILYLLFPQPEYQQFNELKEYFLSLVERFSLWLNWVDEFNSNVLDILFKQFRRILETSKPISFYGLQEIMKIKDIIKKRILLVAIKNRKRNGLTLNELCTFLELDDIKLVNKKLDELVSQELIIKHELDDDFAFDISWVL